jgi:hypothetical protein
MPRSEIPRCNRYGGSVVEPGSRGIPTGEWWDDLATAEPGPVSEARSRLAWFGLDAGAPPLLAERSEND